MHEKNNIHNNKNARGCDMYYCDMYYKINITMTDYYALTMFNDRQFSSFLFAAASCRAG